MCSYHIDIYDIYVNIICRISGRKATSCDLHTLPSVVSTLRIPEKNERWLESSICGPRINLGLVRLAGIVAEISCWLAIYGFRVYKI